jgi:hypothetical protein
MKKILLYIFIALSFFSCEKKVDWPLQNQPNDMIVVDGMITDEQKQHQVKLSLPVSQLNETPQPVTGATVTISDHDSIYVLTEQPANSGIYKTDSFVHGQPGQNYTLKILYNGKEYDAQSYMLSGETFTPLIYKIVSKDGLYHITWVASAYNPENFAMWEILLDWSTVPGYTNLDPGQCKARLLYYTLPTLDVSQVLTNELEKIYFPLGTHIIEKRYTINADYAAFIRDLLSETNWQGGVFDSSHANLPTNVSGNAVGFFSACAVVSYSTVVTP